MRFTKLFALTGITVLLAITALAADVTGKWVAQVPGRGGQTRETTFNLKSAGDQLTGTMTGFQGDIPIKEGKITGDDISFKTTIEFNGNTIAFTYTGKVEGSEIKMKRTFEGGNQPPQEFVAKKAN